MPKNYSLREKIENALKQHNEPKNQRRKMKKLLLAALVLMNGTFASADFATDPTCAVFIDGSEGYIGDAVEEMAFFKVKENYYKSFRHMGTQITVERVAANEAIVNVSYLDKKDDWYIQNVRSTSATFLPAQPHFTLSFPVENWREVTMRCIFIK